MTAVKLNLPRLNHQQGISSLVMVLFAVVILSSIMIAIYAMALVLNRQSTRFYTSQSAFFAAEGAMFETIERMKNPAYDWPGFVNEGDTVTDEYSLGESMITRTITYVEGDDGIFYYQIIIDAYNRGSRRSLEASYVPVSTSTTTTSKDFDIILVLDYSFSMTEGQRAIDALKEAVGVGVDDGFIDLVAALPNSNARHRLGLVIYDHGIMYSHNLTNDFALIESQVAARNPGGGTDIDRALRRAQEFLRSPISTARPDSEKIIVLFSDGIPRMHWIGTTEINCVANACLADPPNVTVNPNGVFEPAQLYDIEYSYYGNQCTHKVFEKAQEIKLVDNFSIYTVFFPTRTGDTACGISDANYQSMYALGRYLMLRASSESDESSLSYDPDKEYQYFHTGNNVADLKENFKDIFTEITTSSGGSIRYHEVDPTNP